MKFSTENTNSFLNSSTKKIDVDYTNLSNLNEMNYLEEFNAELDQMLNDVRVMSKYTIEEVYDNPIKYWSTKGIEIYTLIFKPEVYENINKEFNYYKNLDSKYKKIYCQLLIKKKLYEMKDV